jgi:hypothetical protein
MQARHIAGLHVVKPAAHWTAVCMQYTTVAARLVIVDLGARLRRELLTIQVELHVRLHARVETAFARVLAETRLSWFFSRKVDVEIYWRVEVRDGGVVDVVEIVVEEQ